MTKVRGFGAEGERQYGACKRAGLEHLLHKLREGMGANLIASVLSLASRTPSTAFRGRTLPARSPKFSPASPASSTLLTAAPPSSSSVDEAPPPPPSVLLSRARVRQGDHLGLLYFAIAITPLLRALAARFPALEVDAYCDDVTITAPDEALPKD